MMDVYIRVAGLCLLALSLAACSLAPEYNRPAMPVPATLATEDNLDASGVSVNVQRIGWRDFYKDERLKELISVSIQNNRDMKLAALAVAEAGAQYRVQNSERFPQLKAEGSDVYGGEFKSSAADEKGTAAIALPAFEIDLFGRLKSLSESALQQYLASGEAEKAVRIALVSQVAQTYLDERLAREGLQLAERTLESRRGSHAFIEDRVRSGQSSLLDLEQARGLVEFAATTLAQRQTEVTRTRNALTLLLGRFEKTELPAATSLTKQVFTELPHAIPSAVLLERPDVMRAEHVLRAANADIGAARAAFFPSILLTGNLGYMSNDLQTLFAASTSVWSFVPQVTLPIFTAGRNQSNLELAEVRRQSAVVQYEKTIQTAFREAADGLMTKAALARRFAAQGHYLDSQRVVLDLATQRYISGAASYLEVLDAQRNVFQAEQDLLNIRRDQLVNDINLYSALGGGLHETSAIAQ
ncbi:MAG: efflux transporter outer membrane subunit [Desulfovibrio sp.]|jgi:Cu(I)/Ag(I) efflux system outer membrane protein|nr:efflux transporter outer membrane subunit [Desulfovibrio sp.]